MKGVLKVLMWKHLIVRMRRFIHTPVEIIAPILLFILYYLFKDQIASIPPVNTYNDGIQQTVSTDIVFFELFCFCFFFLFLIYGAKFLVELGKFKSSTEVIFKD